MFCKRVVLVTALKDENRKTNAQRSAVAEKPTCVILKYQGKKHLTHSATIETQLFVTYRTITSN